MCIEQKVEQYREKLIRITEIKKNLIDAEISLQKVMQELNLSQYEFKKLLNGELEEKKVYRALRGLNAERDLETEKGIERALNVRIF